MRYAVFSDIHSNLQAFESVLDCLRKTKIDQYLFVGDIVGYGANPKESIALLRCLNPLVVAGNHDWAVCGLMEIDYFNEDAKSSIFWTRDHIAESDHSFLCGLELVKQSEEFCLVHGTLDHPQAFDYMMDNDVARKTFHLFKKNICFVGHTHKPCVFIVDHGKLQQQEFNVLHLKAGKRYIVDTGSVGQPRDRDSRACFCVYDSEAQTVELKRAAYDIGLAQKRIVDAGLPKILAERLAIGQ